MDSSHVQSYLSLCFAPYDLDPATRRLETGYEGRLVERVSGGEEGIWRMSELVERKGGLRPKAAKSRVGAECGR